MTLLFMSITSHHASSGQKGWEGRDMRGCRSLFSVVAVPVACCLSGDLDGSHRLHNID